MSADKSKILILTTKNYPQEIALKNKIDDLREISDKIVVVTTRRGKHKTYHEVDGNLTVYRRPNVIFFNFFIRHLKKSTFLPFRIVKFLFKESRNAYQEIMVYLYSVGLHRKHRFHEIWVDRHTFRKVGKVHGYFKKPVVPLELREDVNPSQEGRLEAIWLKVERRQPMVPVETATLIANEGIEKNVRGKKRQVTIINKEDWEALMRRLGTSIDPSARRANMMISGVPLRDIHHKVLRIGNTRLLVIDETKPCKRMDEAWKGLHEAMKDNWVGGSYANILEGGEVKVGDPVQWEDPEEQSVSHARQPVTQAYTQ